MPKPRKTFEQLAESGTLARNPGKYAGRAAAAIAPFRPVGRPPKHLPPAETEVWKELVRVAPVGHLQRSDRLFLELCSRLITRMRVVTAKPSELNSVMNVLSKLGLNPTDRSKLNLLPPAKSKKNADEKAWDELEELD